MITSKQIIRLSEEWLKAVEANVNFVDIYENPTSSDFKEIFKNRKHNLLRFIADNKSKKIYAWDAYIGIHYDVAYELGYISRWENKDKDCLFGEASINGSRAVSSVSAISTDIFIWYYKRISSSGGVVSLSLKKELEDRIKIDWSWTNRYIDCTPVVSKLKEGFQKLISTGKWY